MPEVARLWVSVGADTKEAEAGFRRVQSQAHSLAKTLRDIGVEAAGTLTGTLGFIGLRNVFSALTESVIGFNARMEQSRRAWSVMLGDVQTAQAMLRELQRFAEQTPFEFPELEDAARRMLALGFSAKEVIPMMRSVGNAAAAMGMGSQGINRIVLALGQMRAKAKVSAEEMRQLTEAGIPAWRILAEAVGKTEAEVMKLAEQGKISADVFIDAFQKFSEAKFGDMMREQSTTFLGAISTIKDNLRFLVGQGFEPLFQAISQGVVAFAQFTQTADWRAWGMRLRNIVILAIEGVNSLAAAITGLGNIIASHQAIFAGLGSTIGMLVAQWAAFNAVMTVSAAVTRALTLAQAALNMIMRANPLMLVISLLGGLVAGLYTAYQTSEEFRDVVHNAFETVRATVDTAVNWILERLSHLGNAIGAVAAWWSDKFAHIQRVTAVVFDTVGRALNRFLQWLRSLPIVGDVIGEVSDWVGSLAEQVGTTLQGMAQSVGESVSATTVKISGMGFSLGFVTDMVGGLINRINDFTVDEGPSLDNLLANIADTATGTSQAIRDTTQAVKDKVWSVHDLVNALVRVNPVVALLATEIEAYQRAISNVNLAITAHKDQLKAAQEEYRRMQEHLKELRDALSEAQRQLQELAAPRLVGMGDFERKIFAIETHLKRLKLAELLGRPIDEIIQQFPLLTEGAEAYLATLPQTREELQRILEQLRLMQALTFEERLRLIRQAAEGVREEITFEDALKRISETKRRIADLTGAISAQEMALRAQQGVIASIQAAIDRLNETLQHYQAQLAEAQRKQELVTQALQLVYTWLLEGRKKFEELGAEGARVADQMTAEAHNLLMAVMGMATDTSSISAATLAQMVANYQLRMAEALLEVARLHGALDAIPRYIETIHVTKHYDIYAGTIGGPIEERQFGGPIRPGRAYLVGEAGPELIIPTEPGMVVPLSRATTGVAIGGGDIYVTVNVSGSVIAERDLAEAVRREILRIMRRNVTSGIQ